MFSLNRYEKLLIQHVRTFYVSDSTSINNFLLSQDEIVLPGTTSCFLLSRKYFPEQFMAFYRVESLSINKFMLSTGEKVRLLPRFISLTMITWAQCIFGYLTRIDV